MGMSDIKTADEFKKLLFARCTDDERQRTFKEIRKIMEVAPKTDVFILGVKMYAVHMTMLLKKYCGINKFNYVLEDMEACEEQRLVGGYDIISLDEYFENRTEHSIFFAGSRKFIEKYGTRIPKIYNINYGWVNDKPILWSRKLVESNIEMFFHTYCLLSDDRSRQLMVEWMIASLTGHMEDLYRLKTDAQYFNEITVGLRRGVYVDCGAYDGDTIHSFVGFCDKYERIVAFEPDESNYLKLCARLEAESIRNTEPIKAGVYYRNGEVCFNSKSQDITARYIIDSIEGESIDVRSIDSLHIDTVSLIKMDIEGSELDALRGARETIKKAKPMIAVCVYHKSDDLITIPQYICDLLGGGTCKFYLRYHGNSLTELVLYAVPK